MRKTVLLSALFAFGLAFASPMVTPASAQQGCSPYVGGSCGYQDTHPPVAWRGQNPYYNGDGFFANRGGVRRGGGYRHGGAYYHHEQGMSRQTYTFERRMCHDWVMHNGVKFYTGPAHAC